MSISLIFIIVVILFALLTKLSRGSFFRWSGKDDGSKGKSVGRERDNGRQ